MSVIDDYTILVNKTSPLQRDYIPPGLIPVKIPFDSLPQDPKRLLCKEAAQAAERLIERSRQDKITLYGISGYRSYQRQEELFCQSTSGYVAPPGTSEHQTGLALDVSCPAVNLELSQEFDLTDEGKWLARHAPLYGFIIRYPKGKENVTGYPYEPWHIRYVTCPVASYLALTGLTLDEFHCLNSGP